MGKERLDAQGRELCDPTPIELPVGFQRPPSIQEMIKQAVRHELSEAARDLGVETFEEADDFDVNDDFDPRSPWELNYDQESAAISGDGDAGVGQDGLEKGNKEKVVKGEVEAEQSEPNQNANGVVAASPKDADKNQ